MACIPWKPRALCPPVPGALGSEHAARSQKRRMLGREGGSSLPGGCLSQGGGGSRVPVFQEAVLPREVGEIGFFKAAPSTTEVPGGGRACTFRSSRCPCVTGTWSSASLLSKRSDGGSPLYGEGFSVALGSCWGLC